MSDLEQRSNNQEDTMTRIESFRQHKDEFFLKGDGSPLGPDQRAVFAGLNYYPERPDLQFVVTVTPSEAGGRVVLSTTTDEMQEYLVVGTFQIDIDQLPVTLTLLRDPSRGRLFLPFRDGTADSETYAQGRYLDPQERPDGSITVDFNYAYNPYCAYNDQWSCPLPPASNYCDVAIRAGEMRFQSDASQNQ